MGRSSRWGRGAASVRNKMRSTLPKVPVTASLMAWFNGVVAL